MKQSHIVLLLFVLSGCTGTKTKAPVPNFSSAQSAMIMAAGADVPMRVFKINQYEDSLLLRTRSEEVIVNPDDAELQHFVTRLLRTVRDSMSLGVGIAAPQVGILKNIVLVQRFDKAGFPFETYLNPVIRQYTDLKQPCLEGCLSIPDKRDTTQNRAYAILLEYDKMDGSHEIEMIEDFTAVIFQHEIDHLHGILFTDHLAEEIKDAAGD